MKETIEQKKYRILRVKYEEFMKNYKNEHELCPNCGAKEHSSTLVGYVFNHDEPEKYRDLNRCQCLKCGNIHTTHERIKKILNNIN